MDAMQWMNLLPGFGLERRVERIAETDKEIARVQEQLAALRKQRRAQVKDIETRIAELWTPDEIAAAQRGEIR